MVVPLFVGREKSINALEECVSKKLDLFLVAQRQATTVSPGEKESSQSELSARFSRSSACPTTP